MGLHLLFGQILLVWFWLTGPLLWFFVSDFSAVGLGLTASLVALRSLVTWRLWATRGDEEGVLLSTGDVFRLGWLRLHHRLGIVHVPVAVIATGLAIGLAFESGLWVSYLTYLLVRVMFGLRDSYSFSSMEAVLAALDGNGQRVLRNATARRDPQMLAWAYLIEGDPLRAEEALASLHPDGPLLPGSEMKALLELRHGRATLLHRILRADPGDHLMARYRRASLLLHRDLVQGTTGSIEEVRAMEPLVPTRYRRQLVALRGRVEGDTSPLPPETAWMERVYPWLGSPQPELLGPVDTEALVENLFAPPGEDTPGVPIAPRKRTLACFPVEWMPVVSARRGDRFLIALALLFLFAGLLAVMSPRYLPALVALAVPVGLLAAERAVFRRPGIALVTSEGVQTGLYLHPERMGLFTLLRTLRMPALLLIIVLFCIITGLELGGGMAAILGPIGLLGLAAVSSPLVWTRTRPLRWAFGEGAPPTRVDPLLDGHAFVGLGFFLRGRPAEAELAWARSAHPAVGALRQLLRAGELDPEALTLPDGAPICWTWRVAMARALAARRQGRTDLLEADREGLSKRFRELDDPATDLLRAVLDGRDDPILAALDAYDPTVSNERITT